MNILDLRKRRLLLIAGVVGLLMAAGVVWPGGWLPGQIMPAVADFRGEFIVISGIAYDSPDGPQAEVHYIRRLTQISPQVVLHEEQKAESIINHQLSSPYGVVITVEDRRGRILQSRPIIRWDTGHHFSGSIGFFEVLPFPKEATSVKIRAPGITASLQTPGAKTGINLNDGGVVLQDYSMSPNIPVVEQVTVVGNPSSDGKLKVQWRAKDADRDELVYDVLYGYNEGNYWKPLALGQTTSSFVLENTADLPGTDSAVFRVLASDGLNTGQADSDSFKVSNKPPRAIIHSPADGAVLVQGRTAILMGSGNDREDGPMTGESLKWRSSRDGDLGVGKELGIRTLSSGTHIISMVTEDNGGLRAEAKVKIEISQRNSIPQSPKPGDITLPLTVEPERIR